MLSRETIFEMHRLKHLGLKNTQIASQLGISIDSVRRYLENPLRKPAKRARTSKLDS